ncbi:hypothetical protein M501DRAFT_1018523 [Patellaria atrata CBS 101060]|uniref:Conserved oligomeric Golgi complex subunit 1 n=1 Tax=Patellaria atrata CBS 101060 TaxID=1346257 RepID=A0A9P4S7B9_9PEZI|nr:hypothetical protein M501DRAFT_1018523 [Patellaria atrata CBS 101060]
MEKEAPDPRIFKSWEDAFQYPIPVVRKLEQQLRFNVDDSREKLRTLVGASYRDLLGTAERIIDMDENMEQMEETISTIGQKCNSRAIEKIFSNYVKLEDHNRKQNQQHYSYAAQLAVLQSCPGVISRLLKSTSSLLLAAKVLVLSRLLHKTLSQDSALPLLETLRNRLASLRQKLLSYIDKQFSTLEIDVPALIEAMCAFSLATSSTPTDVLRHFHHVRIEAISTRLEYSSQREQSILKSLKLYTRTLHDTQAIFPKRLAESLSRLKSYPLLKDKDVNSVIELKLDIHERWIADEVRNFTPYLRHDELNRTETEKLLRTWAKRALGTVLSGMKTLIDQEGDVKSLVDLRRNVLETWLSSTGRAPGQDSSRVLDDIRGTMLERLKGLIQHRAKEFDTLHVQVSRILDRWSKSRESEVSLWDDSMINMDIGNGASKFKETILARSHGRAQSVNYLISHYDEWARSIAEVQKAIKSMKDTRWDDDFDEEDSDDDELGLDSKQTLLSENDPRDLEEALAESLFTNLKDTGRRLEELATTIVKDDSADSAGKAVFFIRVLREVTQRLPKLDAKKSSINSPQFFSTASTEPLFSILSSRVSKTPLHSYAMSIKKSVNSKRVVARTLWEGNPQLPVQPSPRAFKYLHALTRDMTSVGPDVWSPGAKRVLKKTVAEDMARLIEEMVTLVDEDEVKDDRKTQVDGGDIPDGANDHKVKEMDSTILRAEKITQILYDTLYLRKVFAMPKGAVEKKDSIELAVQLGKQKASLDDAAMERLNKSANDYWKRTYLLFAILA